MEKLNAEVFIKVSETGSFRKAAEEMGYTQAGISYIVSSMEEEMGLTLFIRAHNGVALSPEGEELLPFMKQYQILDQQLEQHVKELRGLQSGTVRVQIFDSVSVHWLPDIIRRFHDDYPKVRIELISEEDSVRAEERVMSGEVDCGFFLAKVHSEMDIFKLTEENFLAVVSNDHPLAQKGYFPLKELGNYPYISMKFEENAGVSRIFKNRRIKPNTIFTMDNDYAAMAMVSKGLGYCILPALVLKVRPYQITCLEFDQPQKRTISIGTRSMDSCSKACRKFIEYTIDWVKGQQANT